MKWKRYSGSFKAKVALEAIRGLTTTSEIAAEFDVILLSHVLEHVDSCDEIIGTLNRLLAPNGKLIIIVPQERIRGDVAPHHFIFYSAKHRRFVNPHVRIIRRKALQNMLKKYGLKIDEHVYINFLPPLVSRAYFWPYAFSPIAVCSRA